MQVRITKLKIMPMNEIMYKRPLINNNMIHNNILVHILR